jgi:hypothetical protein
LTKETKHTDYPSMRPTRMTVVAVVDNLDYLQETLQGAHGPTFLDNIHGTGFRTFFLARCICTLFLAYWC